MNSRFKYFDTTADIGVKAYGKTFEEAFKNAALATMNLITDIDEIKPNLTLDVSITSEDLYGLLYDWITEVLIMLYSDSFIASKYNITITKNNSEYELNAKIVGDTYNTNIYNYKTEVKAITYHLMKISKKDNNIQLKFILDI